MNQGITVLLLAYNEEKNLRWLLPKIKEQMKQTKEDFEILVVDTKEPTDRTKEVCAANGAEYLPQEEPEFGGAFKTGIRHAKGKYLLILDSDGSHDPRYIPNLYRLFRETHADVAIGSRYAPGGTTKDSPSSVVMSKILNFSFRLCLGIPARDISTDYRIYHTKDLKTLHLTCRYYDILQEVLLKLQRQKGSALKIAELPISFEARRYGESKRRLVPFIFSYGKTLLKLTAMRIGGR